MNRLLVVVALLILIGVGWYAFTTLPEQRDILHALRIAEKVTVSEYRRGPLEGGYEDLMTQKELSVSERKELQKAFSLHGLRSKPDCAFDPHHRIDCLMPDKTTRVIHLSFNCEEYALDKGAPTGLGPWSASLRETLPRLGIPVRTAEYAKAK